jgi:putative DNA primase/helicase
MAIDNDPKDEPALPRAENVLPFDRIRARRRIKEAMPARAAEPKQADFVLRSVLANKPGLWRSPAGDVYLRLTLGDSMRQMPVRSKQAARLIRRLHGVASQVAVNGPDDTWVMQPATVSDATVAVVQASLEAMAHATTVLQPCVRIAEYGNAWWLDLGDASGAVVRIDNSKWWIETKRCPAPLIRAPGMLALPIPQRNWRDTSVLADFAARLCLDDENDLMTVLCFLLAALRPHGPYPILIVQGEDGSAKSTVCRLLRDLIDPHEAALEALPESERDLAVIAATCHVLAFDNVSGLTPEQADRMCRLSTGYMFRTRTNYADRDVSSFPWCGPQIVNGIPPLIARSDFASRVWKVRVRRPQNGYRPERTLRDGLGLLRKRMLACVLDGLVAGRKGLGAGASAPDALPRMAGAAEFCMAAAPVFGWTEDDVAAMFRRKYAEAMRDVAANDLVAATIVDWLSAYGDQQAGGKPIWPMAPVGKLYKVLTEQMPRPASFSPQWPRGTSAFAAALARIRGALAAAGVSLIWSEDLRRVALTVAVTLPDELGE